MESRNNPDISRELNIEKYKENTTFLEKTKKKMVEMELFDKNFIDSLNFVFVENIKKEGEDEIVEYCLLEDGSLTPYNNYDFGRTKEVGIFTLSSLDKTDSLFDISTEKNKSTYIWLGNLDKSIFLSFDAVTAHETAHTKSYRAITRENESLFDKEKFKKLAMELIKDDPVFSKGKGVDLSRFDYSDENWSELYAALYHREFLRRENSDNNKMIKEWDNHIIEVADALQSAMDKFNQEKNTDIDPEIIYEDGHAFSYLLARVFEEKYKNFDERIRVLEECKKE